MTQTAPKTRARTSSTGTRKTSTTERQSPARKAPARKAPARKPPVTRSVDDELQQVGRAFDAVSVAVMMANLDLEIVYVNGAAQDLMRTAEAEFRKIWPGFNADNLIGQCVDQFHRDPSHQRRILTDPSRLPFRADVAVGPFAFELVASGVFDTDGEHIGVVLEWGDTTEIVDLQGQLAAIHRSQAVIEFTPEGTILTANDNFLRVTGYSLNEIVGQHHRIFMDPAGAASPAYTQFWASLGRGQFEAGDYPRVTKAGHTVWIRASYNPIYDKQGKVVKVVKYATDITEEKRYQKNMEDLVAEASAVMTAVAEGDLTRTVQGDYIGELVQLRHTTNASISNLSGLVSQIRSSAVAMSSSAKEVAVANQDLSRRTEAQASSLEETASSMEEMTATVQQNADNARKASQLAVSAREQAHDGGQVVERAVGAMLAISESSKKIADIIGVIDEIAFQTNLLALNAAVEAARAGDQGRGFAVVASEVRNLAQRSAGAAKEIKSLIQDSLEKVDDGSNLVNQSGAQLTEIVGAVKKVSDIIAEIAAASEEQSAGITQVNQAVAEMDQGTQQNAAMVEQAAAAAESVQQLSHSLLALAERFRIDGIENVVSAAVTTPAPSQGTIGTARTTPPSAGGGDPSGNGRYGAGARAGAPAPTRPTTQFNGDDEAWQEF